MAYQFDLDAGRVCLDLVNTHSRRTGDHLASYADLIALAHQSALITPTDAKRLLRLAAQDPVQAQGVLTRAYRLRDALSRIFSAIAGRRAPASADLDVLNSDLAATMPQARVVPAAADGQQFTWGWVGGSGRVLDAPLWPIVRSAADLLTAPDDLARVRLCGAPLCAWLFLDTSKNRSRQWCSMQSCGNREKARRHYQRLRASGGEARPRARARRTGAAPAGGASATAGSRAGAATRSAAGAPSAARAARRRPGS